MSDFSFYHISRAGQLSRKATLADVLAAGKEEGFIWLDYRQPEKDDLTALIEPLGLHPLAIEDCLDDNQIPKIEDYPQHTFILFNAFEYTNQVLEETEVDIFIGSNFLVTTSRLDSKNEPVLKNIERYIALDTASARQGPAFLAHILLDYIVDRKFVAIEALEEDLDSAEDTILSDHVHFSPSELVRLRRELLSLRKNLFHEREGLVKITRKDCLYIPEKAILQYRDIYDHLSKFYEMTESSRDLATSLMEMYLSILNNQMTKTANDTNVTVRRLTFITTVFMPLTLLAGVGGMSEYSMMTGAQNWRIAYPAFLLLMVFLGIANYYILKWLDLRRRKSLDSSTVLE
jgi:magnesium transporter